MKSLKIIFISIFSLLSISCENDKEKELFYCNKDELLSLISNDDYIKEFNNTWRLENCYKDEYSYAYCSKDSLIQLQIVPNDGLTISVYNGNFKDIDNLIEELKSSYESIDLRKLENYEEHLGDFNLLYGEFFYDEKVEIILSISVDIHSNESLTITVSSLI